MKNDIYEDLRKKNFKKKKIIKEKNLKKKKKIKKKFLKKKLKKIFNKIINNK